MFRDSIWGRSGIRERHLKGRSGCHLAAALPLELFSDVVNIGFGVVGIGRRDVIDLVEFSGHLPVVAGAELPLALLPHELGLSMPSLRGILQGVGNVWMCDDGGHSSLLGRSRLCSWANSRFCSKANPAGELQSKREERLGSAMSLRIVA